MNDELLIVILVLIGLLFFKETTIKWVKNLLNINKDEGGNEKPPQWATELKNHYNDETTKYLTDIYKRTNSTIEIIKDLKKEQEFTNKQLEYAKECLSRIEREGVRLRKYYNNS